MHTASSNITGVDQTTGQPITNHSISVCGHDAFIDLTAHNLKINATGPNAFIRTGNGDDRITVSSGNNLIDAGGGSNFLTGGSGHDTFIVDDRNSAGDVWNSIVNFHSGDTVIVLGLSVKDFTIDQFPDQGAPGATGLTFDGSAPGRPDQALTLAGFTPADVTSGRLAVMSGADFIKIHAV